SPGGTADHRQSRCVERRIFCGDELTMIGRPSGTGLLAYLPIFPALKCWAWFGRPSGTASCVGTPGLGIRQGRSERLSISPFAIGIGACLCYTQKSARMAVAFMQGAGRRVLAMASREYTEEEKARA